MDADIITGTPRTAIAIFSFNRPQYLKEVLRSIAENTGVDKYEFYLFQDGSINKFSRRIAAKEENILSCLELWEAFPCSKKTLIRNTHNLGIGITQFEAKVLLFEDKHYDQVMFFEDDLVLDRNYIRLLEVLLKQFQNYPRVGAVMCHGGVPRFYSNTEVEININKIRSGIDHLWGWATWRDRWVQIKDSFLEYYFFIRNCDYRQRPNERIVEFYREQGFKQRTTSQDAGIYYALAKNGYFSINTCIHRGKYIGEIGEHMFPQKYSQLKYASICLRNLEADSQIDSFYGFDEIDFWGHVCSVFSIIPSKPGWLHWPRKANIP
jgi:hypothetical protein